MKTMVFALFISGVIALASNVRAEDAFNLKVPTVLLVSAATADMATTQYVLRNSGAEYNPTVAWAQGRPALMFAAGAAMEVGTYFALKRAFRNHPQAMRAAIWIGIFAHGACAVGNAMQTPAPRRF